MMNIANFKATGSDLDCRIEALVAQRLRNGTLSIDEQTELDRLVACRAGKMIPVRTPRRALRYA